MPRQCLSPAASNFMCPSQLFGGHMHGHRPCVGEPRALIASAFTDVSAQV